MILSGSQLPQNNNQGVNFVFLTLSKCIVSFAIQFILSCRGHPFQNCSLENPVAKSVLLAFHVHWLFSYNMTIILFGGFHNILYVWPVSWFPWNTLLCCLLSYSIRMLSFQRLPPALASVLVFVPRSVYPSSHCKSLKFCEAGFFPYLKWRNGLKDRKSHS